MKAINENIRKNNEKIYNLSSDNKVLPKNNNYIGGKNFQGKKQGFGIQINPSGDKFKAIFTNDQVSGWGIFEHKDGDIFRGEYKDDETNGYGEYSSKNAIYYGYWNHVMLVGVGYEIWNDSSSY